MLYYGLGIIKAATQQTTEGHWYLIWPLKDPYTTKKNSWKFGQSPTHTEHLICLPAFARLATMRSETLTIAM